MKKIFNLILAGIMSFSALSFAACQEKGETSTSASAPIVERLEMEKNNLFLTLGDKTELLISYNELEDGILTWTSSAPDIVSVDKNGFVEGLRVGSATVSAHYGTKTVSCNIEVSLGGNVPVLVFDDDVHESITIAKKDSFGLGARVQFNGKQFDDAEVEYYVFDEQIGRIVDGVFVAEDVVGSTQVSVFATWRGQMVSQKTILVNVSAESTVLLNGGKLKDLQLYMAAEHEGEQYATTQTISQVYISEDGKQIDEYTLSVLDEKIARIEKVDGAWEVQAVKPGKTNLLVRYADKEFPFEISVLRPVFDMEEKVEFSVVDGKYFDKDSRSLKEISEMFTDFGSIVSYELDGKEYKTKDGKIELTERQNCPVTIYNESVGYRINIDAHTMLMDELSDFEYIYAGDETKDVAGSYVLVKDIVEPKTILTMPSGKVANNFAGTFDGRGHVLSFTFVHGTEHRFGLFGMFLKGATIKNVALDNITMDGTTGKNAAGIICGEGSDGKTTTGECKIENVFVNLKFSELRTDNLAFMGNAMWKTVMKNVIIHVPELYGGENSYGSFARGDAASVSNCYIISPTVTYSPQPFNLVPVRYDDYEAMFAANNNYSSFSSEYWDISSGVPVWKNLMAKDSV